MIVPHRCNRRRSKTQDGRKLRQYNRRWKIERLFAWLGNFRKLVVRYERPLEELPRLCAPCVHRHRAQAPFMRWLLQEFFQKFGEKFMVQSWKHFLFR